MPILPRDGERYCSSILDLSGIIEWVRSIAFWMVTVTFGGHTSIPVR